MPNDKRSRSQWGDDERAEIGREARRTPRGGVAVVDATPVAVDDEDSSAYDIPERLERRERKPTPHRIRKLEAFKDDMQVRFPMVEANVQFLVDEKREEKRRREKRREWWGKAGLIAVKGVFSSGVIVAVLHAAGIL
jgi:hypothetical protein